VKAEEIRKNNIADFVALARAMLRDPYWSTRAVKTLGMKIQLTCVINELDIGCGLNGA